ncbi:aminotransferase [Clostridium zeae]|uniref:Aminotransferase n=1 Tax=Clostridium zeae TaxID=2759022 RepID=A0ABQ1E723_9CLOT|nr:aminotransferase class I/II-fold pyridoxal phosphate-dependent enzyme [Clostridium zeae]GFZ30570.1 aminotransferase [Clostridium zeae]
MNSNVNKIELSGIRKFSNKVAKIQGAISLTLGQPDFPVPKKIKEAMIEALEQGKTTYTSNAGLEQLRDEISRYLDSFGIEYDKDEICITAGGSEALFTVFTTLIDKGEKVLIPTPAYPAYESCVKLVGGEVVNYKLNNDFSLNIDFLEEAVQDSGSRYLLLSFPTNPTGAILEEKQLSELKELILKYDLTVITDEMYSALCYDEYHSIGQVKEIKDKVIFIGGFSKIFSMTGLRLGYFCLNKDLMDDFMKVHQYNVSCATSISQYGAYVGLRECLNDVEYMKAQFIKRRDYVYNRLKDMGFEVELPKGAFYIFPSIKKFNMSSEEFCELLLEKKKVACVPGSAFGQGGEGFMRISYCYSTEELEKALDLIEEFIKELEK